MANSSTARGGSSPSGRLAVRMAGRKRAPKRPLFFKQRPHAITSIGVSRIPAVIDHVYQDLAGAMLVIVMLSASITHTAQDLLGTIAGRITLRGRLIKHRSHGASNTITHRQGVGDD